MKSPMPRFRATKETCSRARDTALFCASFMLVSAAAPTWAETRPAPERASPSSAHIVFTNFVQAGVEGDGNHAALVGGKIDAFLNIDGRDIGLWRGFSVSAHPEFIYGTSIDNAGFGTLFPLNTAMYHPQVGGDDFELSLNIVQRFGDVSLTLVKMNMLDAASRTPIAGGGGLDGFQHLQLSAPISFTTPPYVLGGLLSIPRGELTIGHSGAVACPGGFAPFAKQSAKKRDHCGPSGTSAR